MLPGFLLAQGDFLSEIIKELPSLHPVGTEGVKLARSQVHILLSLEPGSFLPAPHCPAGCTLTRPGGS